MTHGVREFQRVHIRPAPAFDLERVTEIWQYRDLLGIWVWRDIRVRYRQSAVGLGWALIQPIMILVVFTFVFGKLAEIPSDGYPYPIFAFSGMLPWQYFQKAVTTASASLVTSGGVLTKVYFPRLIPPTAAVLVALVDFLLALAILVVLMLWFGVVPSARILVVPLLLVLTTALALGISLWIAAFSIDFRDAQHALPFAIQMWMYLTPIVYPLSLVPEPISYLYSLNPVVGIVEGFRWVILAPQNAPPMLPLSITTLVACLALYFGVRYFTRQERTLADRV